MPEVCSGTATAERAGMESTGAGLKRMLPELVVSKQKLRQTESSFAVRLKREEGKQNVNRLVPTLIYLGLLWATIDRCPQP